MATSHRHRQLLSVLLILLFGSGLAYLCYATGLLQAREQLGHSSLAATRTEARRIEAELSATIRAVSRLAEQLESGARPPALRLPQLAGTLPSGVPTTLYLLDSQGNVLAEAPSGGLAHGEVPLHLLRPPAGNPSGMQLLQTRLVPLLQVTRLIQRPPSPLCSWAPCCHCRSCSGRTRPPKPSRKPASSCSARPANCCCTRIAR